MRKLYEKPNVEIHQFEIMEAITNDTEIPAPGDVSGESGWEVG